MKARIIKWYNMLLGALLGALGFSSCNVLVDPFTIRCEYGQPHANYKILGKVTDTAGKPIKNIRVVFQPHLSGTSDEVNSWNTDTLYTNDSGTFSKDVLKYNWPDLTDARVVFEDIDGEENGGKFKTATLPYAALTVEQTKKGDDHWYDGDFTVTANCKMEKED